MANFNFICGCECIKCPGALVPISQLWKFQISINYIKCIKCNKKITLNCLENIFCVLLSFCQANSVCIFSFGWLVTSPLQHHLAFTSALLKVHWKTTCVGNNTEYRNHQKLKRWGLSNLTFLSSNSLIVLSFSGMTHSSIFWSKGENQQNSILLHESLYSQDERIQGAFKMEISFKLHQNNLQIRCPSSPLLMSSGLNMHQFKHFTIHIPSFYVAL